MSDERQGLLVRVRRGVIALLLGLIIALLFTPLVLGYVMLSALTAVACNPTATPDAYELSYETLTINSDGLGIPAYFIPADSPATVVIGGGHGGDAGAMLPYAEALHAEGLNVLLLGTRGCVGQPSTFGYLEALDVAAALDYLATRDDVDITRIGLHGFSAGGAASLYAAAARPDVRSVAAMGNYSDFYEVFGMFASGDNVVERLYKLGARWGYEQTTGVRVRDLRPIAAIQAIAPRPMLFVYGSEEPSLNGAYEMAAIAGDAAEFWEVEGVGHGGYIEAYPQETRERLGAFFRRTLLDE